MVLNFKLKPSKRYAKGLSALIILAALMFFGFKWLSNPAVAAWFNDNWSYRVLY